MNKFYDFLDEFKRINYRFLVGPIALPLLLTFTDIPPPWPKYSTLLTAAFEIVLLIISFIIFRNIKKINISYWIVFNAVVMLIACIYYFHLRFMFIFLIETTGDLIVIGDKCTKNGYIIAKYLGQECPHLNGDALAAATYEADRLWTKQSISEKVSLILFSWIVFFSSFVLCVAPFIAYQGGRPVRGSATPVDRDVLGQR